MKKLFATSALLLSAASLLFTSCIKQLAPNPADDEMIAEAYADDLEADVVFSGVYSDVSGVNDDIALTETDIGADVEAPNPLTPRCYTVTITPKEPGVFPKTVTIDFGAGCLCRDGKTRKGKIVTVFTGRLRVPGARATTTFDGFFVNNVHVQGVHIIQNNSSSSVRVITRTVKDGKLSKPNGNFIYWNATHTNTQTAGLGTPNFHWDDEFQVTGTAEGRNNREGKTSTWSRIIGNPLNKKVNCKWIDKGTVTVTHNKKTAILNYGDGTCDNIATISYNGNTRTITLP